MKIPFKITSFLYLFIFSNHIFAQSFSKNDKIIEAGIGLGIYDTKIYQKSTNNSETNKAAAWVYPFSVEYAVANRLAIGVGYKYSSFIMGNEDTVNTNAKVSGNDIVLKPTFHLLKTKKNKYVCRSSCRLSLVQFSGLMIQINLSQKAMDHCLHSCLALDFMLLKTLA
jgi:hypothetical protein